MKYKSVCLLLLGLIVTGCNNEQTNKNIDTVLDAELLYAYSPLQMRQALREYDTLLDGREIYGIQAYKVSYRTKGLEGEDVNASGLLVIPTGLSTTLEQNGLSIVSDSHGTISDRCRAPTALARDFKEPQLPEIVLSALGGFITARADYLGFGDSRTDTYMAGDNITGITTHPYLLKKHLAKDSSDFIYAVKDLLKKNHIKLDNKLFMTGYSQGGYVSMALLNYMQETKDFNIVAAAPMAGPYDLKLAADITVSGTTLVSPAYTAYILYSYTREYDQELFDAINIYPIHFGYRIKRLFSFGMHSIEFINEELPSDVGGENGLLSDLFIEDYKTNELNWFRKAVIENSVDDWKPTVPIRLVHCKGDVIVPYEITKSTFEKMKNNGVEDIELITPDTKRGLILTHAGCFQNAYIDVVQWFMEKRDE